MDFQEYKNIKNLTYSEYCEYLKNKYGEVPGNYYNEDYSLNFNIKRFMNESLYIHHIKENIVANLSDFETAKNNLYEYQKSINLCYCDILEHYYLHILICEETNIESGLGVGGVLIIDNIIKDSYPENLLYQKLKNRFELWLSSQSVILEHNATVYAQLEEYLEYDNKAIVVIGTSGGKTTTALEYINKSGKKGLVIVPNNTIKLGWKENPQVDVISYQAFSKRYLKFDYTQYCAVICDEVHHIGADKWGEALSYILDNNLCKVIGLTATPNRTDNKDIVNTFFGGNICQGIDIISGIEQNIFHPFTYVGAYYDINEVKAEFEGKDIETDLLGELDIALNNTPTLKQIITDNMPTNNRKGIIFAENISAINEAIDLVKDIYPNVEFRSISSRMDPKIVSENREWFKHTSEGYLCSVNMISEGAHYPGVNTLMLFRRTSSELLFTQQIGRAVTLTRFDDPKTVVFDFVNNASRIGAIKDFIKKEGMKSLKEASDRSERSRNIPEKTNQIIVRDYTESITETLYKIKESLDNRWTEDEDNIIKENYPKLGALGTSKLLKRRSRSKITDRARKLGVRFSTHWWSEEEDKVLQEFWVDNREKALDILKNRSFSKCQQRALKLRLLQDNYYWSDYEIKLLKKYYPLGGKHEVKKYISSKTLDQIAYKASTLKLKSKNHKKQVRCIETNEIYDSASAAARATGIKCIDSCARGICHTAGGYRWEYIENPYPKKENCSKKGKKVICIETGNVFDSAKSASDYMQVRAIDSYIRLGKKCKGYTFKYLNEKDDK